MSVVASAQRILHERRAELPASLHVQEIHVEDHTDWAGEPALRVTVIIAEQTDVENVSGRDVSELKHAIRTFLALSGIDRFPYTYIAKASELAEQDEEESSL